MPTQLLIGILLGFLALPVAVAMISLLAVIPFFFLGAIGKVLGLVQERQSRKRPPEITEPASEAYLWPIERASLAERFLSPSEEHRRAS
jgi:hypothetical protein